MATISQSAKSNKVLVVIIVLELAVCAVLGIIIKNERKKAADSEVLATKLMEQFSELEKTTVPAEDYKKVISAVQSVKTAAVGLGQISSAERLDSPEQICAAVKQVLMKQQQAIKSAATALSEAASTPTAGSSEVDFLVSVVDKEISQTGVIDSAQTERYALPLYHMQKVLDALGYKLSASIKTTHDAVLKFQTDNQLKADGKIGSKTWAKVRELWEAKKPKGPMPVQTPAMTNVQTRPQSTTPIQTRPQNQTSPLAKPRTN